MDPYKLIPKFNSGDLDLLLQDLLMEMYELEALERQQQRARLLQNNLKRQKNFIKMRKDIKSQTFAPYRVEAAVSNLVEKKGINRNPAFAEVIEKIREKNKNWNVTAEGVGEAYGPWLKGGANAVNATRKKAPVAPPPVPVQPAKPAVIPAPWHLETANQKRQRLANAATKLASKKGGKRKTRKNKKN